MIKVLSADAFLMKRVPHGDFHPLKYTQKAIYKGEPMSIQALQRTVAATSYYDVDMQKYREALRRLKKAKRELNGVHGELLELFVYDIIAENHSPYDVYTKISRLNKFLKWLERHGKDITTCTGFDITRYLVQEINPSNRHRIAADIKRFVRFLKEKIDEGYEKLYASFKVKKPRDYPPPPIPPNDLLEKIFQYSSTFYKALFAVLYEGGLRCGEVLSIRLRHVEEHGDYIKIIVPKSKSMQRAVYIVGYQKYLREWLAEHPWKELPDAYLFPARTKGPYIPLNPTTIYNYIRRLKERIGINTRFYPHLLRHKRATELYKKLNEKEMMELFGWKTREMLDIYARITQKDVEEKVLAIYGVDNGGKQGEIICPRCGTRNPAEANYCWRCGTPLKAEVIAKNEYDKKRLWKLIVRLWKELRPDLLEELSNS